MSTALPEHITVHLPALRRWCLYRERSSHEALLKIRSLVKGIESQEAASVIGLLVRERFIDDNRFAMHYAQGKHRRNHWGRMLIRQGLKKAGIPDELAKEAVCSITDEEYENTLSSLLEAKARSTGFDGSLHGREKLYRYATGKGYETELVFRVMDTLRTS